MKKRDKVPVQYKLGMRKTPSDDVSVTPDRDTSSMPVDASLIFKADGNEGKLIRSVGRYNHEQNIPAVQFGLGRARVAANESRGLTEVQARLANSLVTDNSLLKIGLTTGAAWNGLECLPADTGLELLGGKKAYRTYPVDFATTDASSNLGSVGLVQETCEKVVPDSTIVNGVELSHVKHDDPRNALGFEVAGVAYVGGPPKHTKALLSQTASLVAHSPLLSGETIGTAHDRMHKVTPTSWHNRFAESKIQTRGDYLRANSRVLKDLAANMHQFQEYESTGLFARGFRSNLWSKRSDDEIRVLGEMMHLGESLMRGFPVTNRYVRSNYTSTDQSLAVVKTRIVIPFYTTTNVDAMSKAQAVSAIKHTYRLDAGQSSDLDTLAASLPASGSFGLTLDAIRDTQSYNWQNVANSATPGLNVLNITHMEDGNAAPQSNTDVFIITGDFVGTDSADKPLFGNHTFKFESEAAYNAVAGLNSSAGFTRGNCKILIAAHKMRDTLGRLEEVTSNVGALGIDDNITQMSSLSIEGSVNPFFVHLTHSNLGPMRLDSSHPLNENRSPGMQTDGFFACIPGLENHLSLAHVIEGELMQPDSRDFKFEAFWHGLAWLFESDSSDPVGRHWGSTSKFVRTLSPDFKSGAVHDLRSKSARTDVEIIKAAYLLGHTKIDDIKMRNLEPVTDDGFFDKSPSSTSEHITLVDLYDTRGFIDEKNRSEFVSQVDDLALRNIQTTNDFIRGQQAVGEASTSVYHRQAPDGGEYSVKLDATLMSFGAFDYLAPSIVMFDGTRTALLRNVLADDGTDSLLMQDFVNSFVPELYPRTSDWTLINQATQFDYNILTMTFCRFSWNQSWAGLRALTRSVNPASSEWWDTSTVFTPSTDRVVSLTKFSEMAELPSTLGSYFLDLSIKNPIYRFMEITSEVYSAMRSNLGAAPYQSKINFNDLIDINLIKQVTLSTGSPALQQLLDSMMTYALRNENTLTGKQYMLKRLSLHRGLWDRRLHPRDAPYTRQELPLVPFVLLDDTKLEDLPSLISNTNIFLHDLGYAGYSAMEMGPAVSSGMVRTIYTNMVSVDGTVYDYAITAPDKGFDYKLLGSADNEHTLVSSVKNSVELTGLSHFLPGFRHYSLHTQQVGTDEQAFPFCWTTDYATLNPRSSLLLKETDSSGETLKPERFHLELRPAFLDTTMRLIRANKFRELPTGLVPNFYFYVDAGQLTMATATTPGTRNSSTHTIVEAYAVVDGTEVVVSPGSTAAQFTITGDVRQLPDNVVFHSSRAAASGHIPSVATGSATVTNLVFPELTTFDADVIGAISGLSRQSVDESLFYHSRKPRFAFLCPDVFSLETQLYSQCLHLESGQRVVGPMSYAISYDSSGAILNSLREVYSIVGSGEQLKGTPAEVTTSTDVVASDSDESSKSDSDDYTNEDGE